VPAQYLAYIVKRGNVAGDGVVVFDDYGVISVGGADVVLRHNETYTVPGRPCMLTGYTSLGTPLEVELVYGGHVVARGTGSVRGYCIEGSYRARYRFSKSGAVKYEVAGEALGNVTVETVKVTFAVLGLFQQPLALVEEEVPLGKSVELNVGNFSTTLVPQPPVTKIRHYPVYTLLGIFTLALAVAGIVISIVFNERHYTLSFVVTSGIISNALISVYVLSRVLNLLPLGQVPSIELDTLTAVSGLVAPLAYLVVSTPWRLWPWAIPSAVLASLYAVAVWTSLGALEPWHVLIFMLAWIAFHFGLHGITTWICLCIPKPHSPEKLSDYVSICRDVGFTYTPTAEDRTRRYCGSTITIMSNTLSKWPLFAVFLFSILLLPYWGDTSLTFVLTTTALYIFVTAIFLRSIEYIKQIIPTFLVSYIVFFIIYLRRDFVVSILNSLFNFGYAGVALLAAATAIALVMPYTMYLLLYVLTRRGKGDLDTADEVLNKLNATEAVKAETPQTMPRQRVGEVSAVGDFCLEYPGGVIPLSAYTVVGRRDFSGLPEQVLAKIDEKHFAVYFKDGKWWVEDLGSRYGTYLNGFSVKKRKLREGDVISPGVAVAVVFKRCETTRRVVPMEDETRTY